MNVLFDLNVLLDVFLNRSPWVVDSAAVLQATHVGTVRGHISAATLPTLYYVVRRNADLTLAQRVIDECLQSFDVISVQRSTCALARTFSTNDFEDNLQIACAMEASLDVIVTRDASGFANSPIEVRTPTELLQQLAPATP